MILSRYRELAANAGPAAITGPSSALASALLKVSAALDQVPTKDLRAAVALNAFNLVAVASRRRRRPHRRMLTRLTATHPPLPARLDALRDLERSQQLRSADPRQLAGTGHVPAGWLTVMVRSIQVDEAELIRVLGDPYGTYQTRTGRLIPGVW